MSATPPPSLPRRERTRPGEDQVIVTLNFKGDLFEVYVEQDTTYTAFLEMVIWRLALSISPVCIRAPGTWFDIQLRLRDDKGMKSIFDSGGCMMNVEIPESGLGRPAPVPPVLPHPSIPDDTAKRYPSSLTFRLHGRDETVLVFKDPSFGMKWCKDAASNLFRGHLDEAFKMERVIERWPHSDESPIRRAIDDDSGVADIPYCFESVIEITPEL